MTKKEILAIIDKDFGGDVNKFYEKYPTMESFKNGGNLPRYAEGDYLTPGFTNFAGTLDTSQSLNTAFEEKGGAGANLVTTGKTGVSAINPIVGAAIQAGTGLGEGAYNMFGGDAAVEQGGIQGEFAKGSKGFIDPASLHIGQINNAQKFFTRTGKQQIDPNTGQRLGSDVTKAAPGASILASLGVNDPIGNILPTSMSQIFAEGGAIAQSGGDLFMQEVGGQAHSGPNGGTHIDANGSASAASGKEPIAIAEDGEIIANIKGENYVFPKIMRNRVKPIMDRIAKRKHDKATKETAEIELEQLKNENEERKALESFKAQSKAIEDFQNAGGDLGGLVMAMGGALPMYGGGDYLDGYDYSKDPLVPNSPHTVSELDMLNSVGLALNTKQPQLGSISQFGDQRDAARTFNINTPNLGKPFVFDPNSPTIGENRFPAKQGQPSGNEVLATFSTDRTGTEKLLAGIGYGAQALPSALGLVNMPKVPQNTAQLPQSPLADYTRLINQLQAEGDRTFGEAKQTIKQSGLSQQEVLSRLASLANTEASTIGGQKSTIKQSEEDTNRQIVNADALRAYQNALDSRESRLRQDAVDYNTRLQLAQNLGSITGTATRDQIGTITQNRQNEQLMAALMAQNPDFTVVKNADGTSSLVRKKS